MKLANWLSELKSLYSIIGELIGIIQNKIDLCQEDKLISFLTDKLNSCLYTGTPSYENFLGSM